MIKAICFDLDGVYFTEAGFRRFKGKIMDRGVPREDVDYILHEEPMEKFKRGEVGEATFWQDAILYWKLDVKPEEVAGWLMEGYEVNPEVEETVGKLRESGYKTCICSNNFVTRVVSLEGHFNFLKNFDVAVFSYEVGVLKPDKKIFEELVERLGVSPEELVYSDDNETKLGGAKEIGINAFVFSNYDQYLRELRWLDVEI